DAEEDHQTLARGEEGSEKKDRRRLRERARMANKRKDPAYLLREAEKKAKKREDSDVRDKENAQQRAHQA
ncbi:hypothetical protein THAOC_32660, partial [Thalassiosira oceanica]